jgi:hypothetical protein
MNQNNKITPKTKGTFGNTNSKLSSFTQAVNVAIDNMSNKFARNGG